MKKLMAILLVACFCATAYAGGTLKLKSSDTFMKSHDVPDSAGTSYNPADSVNVTTVFQDGTVSLDSVWYNAADAQATAINDALVYFDVWDDMNGSDGIGTYIVNLRWYDGSGAALDFRESYAVQQVMEGVYDTASLAAAYGHTIWIDGGASNTNTVAGTDGMAFKPVSTLAAAKTLADLINVQQYNIINSSSLTLAATHENWKFIGIGEGSLIDLGSQDVDGSVFEHLMISGTQGGTGIMGLHDCYLNTIDSLEAIVISSSFSDTISLRVSTNTVFDQCYSHVEGNQTPGLDFNSAGVIGVDVRHYSGGLTLFNMTSTHTISYEADGQLIIDASCTSANVTARGNMDITNNGTTTVLTENAVFNQTITQTTLDVVNAIVLVGTNISTIAEADSLTDGIETNTFVATQIHDGIYYQIAESDGVVGTNLNINTFIQFDIGADTKPFALIHHGRLDEGSAPSGGDTLHIWVYDWSGLSWTHINPPEGDFIGIVNSSSSDDETFEIQLIDPNFVSDDSGKVRIAYSNYDPDGATANNLEEDTEFYLDFAFIEYQSVLSASTIAAEVAAYPAYTYKMVVRGSPTTIAFEVSYIVDGDGNSPSTEANDFCLGMLVQAQGGNSNAKAVMIADFAIADSTFTIRPGFASAPTVGDTMFIRPIRGAAEPSDWTQHEILLSATGRVRADSVETGVLVGDINQGVVDSEAVNFNQYYKFWSYDDSTAADLNNELTQWLINNLGAAGSTDTTAILAMMLNNLFARLSQDTVIEIRVDGQPNVNVERWNNALVADLMDELTNVWRNQDTLASVDTSGIGQWLKNNLSGSGSWSVAQRDSILDATFLNRSLDALDTTKTVDAIIQVMRRIGLFADTGTVSINFNLASYLVNTVFAYIDSVNTSLGFDGTTDAHAKLDSIITLGPGDGPRLCSLFVWDGSGALTGGKTRMTSGAETRIRDINGSGFSVFNLTDATWTGLVYAAGYSQDTIPQTFIVTASFKDTISMSVFSPSAPAGDLCTVYNWVKDGNDNPIKGVRVTAKIPHDFWPIKYSGQSIVANWEVSTDSLGLWELPIYPSTILETAQSDSASYWQISGYEGSRELFSYKVTVPDSATFKMVPDSE